MTSWVLAGGGAFAREVAGWVRSGTQPVRGYVDESEQPSMAKYGLKWLGSPAAYKAAAGDSILVAIGDPAGKNKVVTEMAGSGAQFGTFIHSSALIHPMTTIGKGCIVCPGSVVSADAVVGDFVTINLMCTIGHDVVLGRFSNLSAHVDLTGGVQIGESVFFGSGARVLPGVKIGNQVRIGAGATVVRNVPDGATVYTAPAKRL